MMLDEALVPDGDAGKNRAAGQVVVPFVAAGVDRAAGRNNVRAREADMGSMRVDESKRSWPCLEVKKRSENERRTVTTGERAESREGAS